MPEVQWEAELRTLLLPCLAHWPSCSSLSSGWSLASFEDRLFGHPTELVSIVSLRAVHSQTERVMEGFLLHWHTEHELNSFGKTKSKPQYINTQLNKLVFLWKKHTYCIHRLEAHFTTRRTNLAT
jgi:hypothetical protein